jgi:hypothetical protein
MPKHSKTARGTDVPSEVAAIRSAIRQYLNQKDPQGRVVGNAKYGVYCFLDYEGEPIYVGQTKESLRQGSGRHLTNQRTDAAAMNVLDPFEVLTIELYPLWDLNDPKHTDQQRNEMLNRAEYSLYLRALKNSRFQAVLNEADISACEPTDLPEVYKGQIVPDTVYQLRKHPDIRLARRAMTVANLARVISERDVSVGLRRTLLTQARRLVDLAHQRLEEFEDRYPIESGESETGDLPHIDEDWLTAD